MTFVIAIDGHAASGKGTIAKGVAQHFGFSYLDTGLIYRAVAQQAMSKSTKPLTSEGLVHIARNFKLKHLELENLRSSQVAIYASEIATLPEVRLELMKFQRNFAFKSQGAVLDGRDIGTVIVPTAQVKFFITADINTRAERRYQQLIKDEGAISSKSVLEDLSKRDGLDSDRLHSPLKISTDAHLIDTTELSIEASIAFATRLVEQVKEKI